MDTHYTYSAAFDNQNRKYIHVTITQFLAHNNAHKFPRDLLKATVNKINELQPHNIL